MPRARKSEPNPVSGAVRELRNQLGLTQLEFGAKVGRGRSTVQHWDRGIAPAGEVLIQLTTLAYTSGYPALAEVFEEATSSKQLGHEGGVGPISAPEERVDVTVHDPSGNALRAELKPKIGVTAPWGLILFVVAMGLGIAWFLVAR